MEAQLSSSSSFPAQEYTQSWISTVPADGRFLSTSYQRFPAETSIEGKVIKFVLSRFEAANIYLIQDTVLEICCKITTSDGQLPAKEKNVAPVNNVLHSAFESVNVCINDKSITPNPSNYHLKSYISQTLSFSNQVKSSVLESQGYYADFAPQFSSADPRKNSGFALRNKLFRKEFKDNEEYRSEGCRFIGKLNLDLISCETGLPPGTKVQIELKKSDDAFILMKEATDTEKYKFVITDCVIYVPVAVLSLPVFNQLSSLMTEHSVSIHYRKCEIREVSLPKNKVEYYSDNLFSDDIPCRIVVWCVN